MAFLFFERKRKSKGRRGKVGRGGLKARRAP